MGTVVAVTTDAAATPAGAVPHRPARRRPGPDRLTVALFSLAAFLVLLALLAGRLRAAAVPVRPRPVAVVHRVYRTTVVETVIGASRAPGTPSVTQSVSSTGTPMAVTPAAPVTRTS